MSMKAYLEHDVLLENVLDHRHLVLGLALRERCRLDAAVEDWTVGRELGHFRQLLGVVRLGLCSRGWWWGGGFRR